MKRLLLAAALTTALTLPAYAVNVIITVGAKSRTFVISAPNAARFQAWALSAYPTIPNPACASPTPPVPCNPLVNPEPVLSAIDGMWAGMRANVLSFEREKAKSAVPDPADID